MTVFGNAYTVECGYVWQDNRETSKKKGEGIRGRTVTICVGMPAMDSVQCVVGQHTSEDEKAARI